MSTTPMQDTSRGGGTKTPVLIIGAGPTGLVLAVWLSRMGVSVRIVDRATGPGTTSRALAVQTRTLEFYRQIEIADAVISGGVKIPALNFWAAGKRTARVPFARVGEGVTPYPFVLVFPQDAHERLLVEHLQTLGVYVERETELLHFEQHDAGVRATLRRSGGPPEVCEASYLAGCDGASSRVRDVLGVGFPGGTYEGRFYVADVEAEGAVTDGELHADIEATDFVLVFPLKGTGRIRLVGVVRDLREGGDRELAFADIRGRAVNNLGLNIKTVNWFSTYRVHHRVAERFRSGRVFLLGDAAHVHSPVGGQGMNTGIGDAVNLSWKLKSVLSGEADERLLDSFEPERIAFARRLVKTTDRAFTLISTPGRFARLARSRVVPLVAPLLAKLGPARSLLFRTASQTSVNYRGGPLSEGRARKVRGGDRLPWVETSPGADNFAFLASLYWQVHVYGDVSTELTKLCATLRLPLHTFSWQPSMGRSGLARDASYLIRPDGYVALADPGAEPERLKRFLVKHGLQFREVTGLPAAGAD